MNKLKKYIKNYSYVTMKDLRNEGFQTRDIRKLVNNGFVKKIKSGLYKYSKLNMDNEGFIDISKSVTNGIICLVSALEYHNLSTVNPDKIYVAIPHSEKKVNLIYPPVKFFFFRKRYYDIGIEKVQAEVGSFKIYIPEKTICDMFRYRNKLGEDLALEGLKNYLKRQDANINKLWKYAIRTRVKTIIKPYMKAMVAE
ncbi:MAG: Abortive infection protein AbiEi [Candidatus Cloacimonetes bacterium]|nr:Abortive infection protein AbiEi [Candidatus Cloacimonadota bacterium]MBS3768282.1 Abortive infection protein AbiEi [Candidatus Cloacimonadota bacterium]